MIRIATHNELPKTTIGFTLLALCMLTVLALISV